MTYKKERDDRIIQILRKISTLRPFQKYSFQLPSSPNFEEWWFMIIKTILTRIFVKSSSSLVILFCGKSARKRNMGNFFGVTLHSLIYHQV